MKELKIRKIKWIHNTSEGIELDEGEGKRMKMDGWTKEVDENGWVNDEWNQRKMNKVNVWWMDEKGRTK